MFSRRAPLYYLALFLVVAGARLWAVAEYGSSVPIRDQWDYEGAAVFKPWLDGTLSISDLFRPHNEHRLAFSRLTGLLLLRLNGQWDSRVEMVVGAVLCGVFAVVMTAAMIRLFGPAFRTLIVEGVALWLVLPYAQENTIMALGLPYYFLLIFSVIAIWGLALHDTYSAAWGAGAVSLVLACLDMGSA
jgi:hypothetical protein